MTRTVWTIQELLDPKLVRPLTHNDICVFNIAADDHAAYTLHHPTEPYDTCGPVTARNVSLAGLLSPSGPAHCHACLGDASLGPLFTELTTISAWFFVSSRWYHTNLQRHGDPLPLGRRLHRSLWIKAANSTRPSVEALWWQALTGDVCLTEETEEARQVLFAHQADNNQPLGAGRALIAFEAKPADLLRYHNPRMNVVAAVAADEVFIRTQTAPQRTKVVAHIDTANLPTYLTTAPWTNTLAITPVGDIDAGQAAETFFSLADLDAFNYESATELLAVAASLAQRH